jgi:hypothetical protein
MVSSRVRLVAVVSLMLTFATMAEAWELPLTVQEQQGVAGPRRVTCGVPLLPGQAKDVKDLRLLAKDTAGKTTPVSAQFRELARWWRADNSIRWVLVDFATDIGAKESQTFVLTDAKVDAPATKLTVKQSDDLITIDTGAARFVVNRKQFNFLDKAIIDLNGDGKLDDSENMLAGSPECGTVAEDAFGQKWLGSRGTGSVEVLESGPMRVCVRARGRQLAPEGKGYAPGLYGYDIFMNFYAGSTDVYADLVITNNPAKSIGFPAMEDCSLVLKLAGGATGYAMLGDKDARAIGMGGGLAAGESVCLYQDSNGADTWETCSGMGRMETSGWKKLPDQLTSFRGYRIYKRTTDAQRAATQADGGGEVIGQGDHARGTLNAYNGRGGVVMHLKNFWQQFPKSAEAGADGTIRLGMWPREWRWPHCIADCSAKGYEVVLHFYSAATKDVQVSKNWNQPAEGQAIADCWDSRVFARPALEHIAATGALSDVGPYTVPVKNLDRDAGSTVQVNIAKMFTDDKLYGNAFGWRVFGERWRSQGGHGSRGARQPIDQDNFLYQWYVTGQPGWLASGDARSRHYRDSRCYRIDDQDALGFKSWAEFRVANTSERREWTNRPLPDNDDIRKYRQGLPGYGTNWEFPNPEHCVLDLLYDRYLIFGDVRSLENMRVAAGHGGYFAIGYAPKPGAVKVGGSLGRANGWSWRTLERYWELTGDKRAGEMLADVIKGYEPLIGKENLWFADDKLAHASDWFTQIFTRAAAMTALHTGDPKALEICKALAIGKEIKQPGSITYGKQGEIDARMFSTLFAVLYHLTGVEKYKAPLADAIKGDGMLNVGGYYQACDHWLLTHPPRAK